MEDLEWLTVAGELKRCEQHDEELLTMFSWSIDANTGESVGQVPTGEWFRMHGSRVRNQQRAHQAWQAIRERNQT